MQKIFYKACFNASETAWTRSWSSICFWFLKIFNCFSSFQSNGEVLCVCILIVEVKEANLLPRGAHIDGENEWKPDPLRSALPAAPAVTGELPVRSAALLKCRDTRVMGRARSCSLL